MPLNLDPESAAARDFAKRCVPEGESLDVGLLLSAFFHATDLNERVPELEPFFQKPEVCSDEVPREIPLSRALVSPVTDLAKNNADPITPVAFFSALLWSPPGMSFAAEKGVPEEALNRALATLRGEADTSEAGSPGKSANTTVEGWRIGWRGTERRKEALEELNPFGRMLTEGRPPQEKIIGMDEEIQALLKSLVKRKQRSALIIGLPGVGKTALVRELARRLMVGDPNIPTRMRDYDIFELSSNFLKAGTSLVGQYEERVNKLIKTLSENSKIILFVDEVHSLLQSGMHEKGNFTEANEAFKKALAQGDFSMIGATTTAEFRHYLEPDQALVQRFSIVSIQPPTPGEVLAIVEGRLPEIEGFYDVEIPAEILRKAVDLTEEYLPTRAQPRKAIQLLDEACAYCVTRTPPLEEVTEGVLWESLEDTVGHELLREETLTQGGLFGALSRKIVGQDEALEGICRAFISGLGGWVTERDHPRGVFLFGGPTGVGKTETALLLAKELGGGREALVRVDCNTLQPSGGDSGHALNVLLGPAPGYIGYVRGKGGLLSRIREHPESIVLFDEIEKADPGVGELLLQILDSGRCEDNDGNLLDFRRAFIVFTTNAGVVYDAPKTIGFLKAAELEGPRADVEKLKAEIRRKGLGEEFLGRISHYFIFGGLSPDAVTAILETQLEKLQDTAELRGYELEWGQGVVGHLVSQWQPRFGVRHLLAILRNRIVEQLSVADAQGELDGVGRIRLTVADEGKEETPAGTAIRERKGDTLVIGLG